MHHEKRSPKICQQISNNAFYLGQTNSKYVGLYTLYIVLCDRQLDTDSNGVLSQPSNIRIGRSSLTERQTVLLSIPVQLARDYNVVAQIRFKRKILRPIAIESIE